MLDIEEIKSRLKDRKLTRVASVTGLSYPTVLGVANGDSTQVRYETVKILSDYLEQNQ